MTGEDEDEVEVEVEEVIDEACSALISQLGCGEKLPPSQKSQNL